MNTQLTNSSACEPRMRPNVPIWLYYMFTQLYTTQCYCAWCAMRVLYIYIYIHTIYILHTHIALRCGFYEAVCVPGPKRIEYKCVFLCAAAAIAVICWLVLRANHTGYYWHWHCCGPLPSPDATNTSMHHLYYNYIYKYISQSLNA